MTAMSGPLALVARAGVSPAAVAAKRKRVALAIAVVADVLQGGLFAGLPMASWIPSDVMDVGVVAMLVALLGFRFRFLIALAIELVPGAQLFPSWTAFVLSLPTRESSSARPDCANT